jgi:hypothetical protein
VLNGTSVNKHVKDLFDTIGPSRNIGTIGTLVSGGIEGRDGPIGSIGIFDVIQRSYRNRFGRRNP